MDTVGGGFNKKQRGKRPGKRRRYVYSGSERARGVVRTGKLRVTLKIIGNKDYLSECWFLHIYIYDTEIDVNLHTQLTDGACLEVGNT